MEKKNQKKQYHFAIDCLRVLAILAVILIHTSTKTLEVTRYTIEQTPMALFLNQVARFAVPLFFFISGFVLELNYREKLSYALFFKRRASKVIIPYLFWSIFYHSFIFHLPITLSLVEVLLYGDASYQLYFIPTLIIFYLAFPLMHQYYRFFANWITLSCIWLAEFVLLSYDYYHHAIHLHTPIRVALLNFGVFILGMVASHHETRILSFVKKRFIFLLILLIFFTSYVVLEAKSYYLNTHHLDALYSNYRPAVYVFTIILSLVLFYLFNNLDRGKKLVRKLSQLSFFVFFIHVEVLYLYWNNIGSRVMKSTHQAVAHTLWYDPLVFIFVGVLSFAIAFICHKIPKLKKLTG